MLERKKSRHRGFITTWVMAIVAIFIIYVGVFWARGWFASTKAQEIMTSVILANRDESSDDKLKEIFVERLQADAAMTTLPDDYSIYRSSDGKSIQVKLNYQYPVTFPLISSGFSLRFTPEITENLQKSGF